MPIRLSPKASRMRPISRIKLGIGRGDCIAGDPEQGAEGIERIEPPVEAEGEFVEVGLQVLRANAVMNATQPSLQIGEDEMDDRQILFGSLRIAELRNPTMFVAATGEADITGPVVGNDLCPGRNGFLNEAAKRSCATIRHNGEPNAASVSPTLARVELGAGLALADLYSTSNKDFVVNATALAARPATDPGLIDLDMFAWLATNPVLIGAHHAGAELVEN